MFEIDKKKFGIFISELRKEQGMTQKELAEKLFVSDKAVSKWECGGSMPDITLLMPMAKIFKVTVPELLECRRYAATEQLAPERAEAMMSRVIQMTDEEKAKREEERRKYRIVFVFCAVVSLLGMLAVYSYSEQQELSSTLLIVPLVSVGIAFCMGVFFCFGVKEKLPTYYDENKISIYIDGIFRMNLPGVHFNNSNWCYIIKTMRIWSMTMLLFGPVLWFILTQMDPSSWKTELVLQQVLLIGFLVSLFAPLYVVGKKYE